MTETSRPADDSVVRVERPVEGIVLVTLDRPDSLNALDVSLQDELAACFTAISADDSASVVILTGAGRGFSSGADLAHAVSDLRQYTSAEIMARAAAAVAPLHRMPQLTIAAVNGPAVGGGWGLAMACDLRIAGPAARFIATFGRMGLGPDCGLSQTLPRAVGRQRALELILTGREVDPEEALRLGIVTSVEEDPVAAAFNLARKVLTVPPRTIRSVKQSLAAADGADFVSVVEEIEAKAQAALLDHPDFLAGAMSWFARHDGSAT